jgi:hypothetical protein
MYLIEENLAIPAEPGHLGLLAHISEFMRQKLGMDEAPIRFVVTESDEESYHCEVATLVGNTSHKNTSVFRFAHRRVENPSAFNAIMLVPTGIGAELGGHAGDAAPAATLLASVCDNLIIHPNVVNASDIIELPSNALYVEGSVISRLLMGTAGLQRVRNNRLLVVIDAHEDEFFTNIAVNSVNAARASYGLICPQIVRLEPRVTMKSSYTPTGRAAGEVTGLESLFKLLEDYRGDYDAVAISSVISVPPNYHQEYFDNKGSMVNPWGGVEAMLTHTISSRYDVPSAHSPMIETQEIANMDPGIVDPRMAAEAVSVALLQCVLKGLQKSPRVITDLEAMRHHSVLTASDISCLVIPDGCLGLPTLACLEQGIPVISVRENKNIMRNNLTTLPWAHGQFYLVDNYWEAAGVMAALRAGIDPRSVRRPFGYCQISRRANELASTRIAITANGLDSKT